MAEMSRVLARLKREPLADLPIADHLNQLLAECGHAWRDRLLPPLVTLRLFLIQILSGNVAINALRQLAGLDFAPSSYCDARGRGTEKVSATIPISHAVLEACISSHVNSQLTA